MIWFTRFGTKWLQLFISTKSPEDLSFRRTHDSSEGHFHVRTGGGSNNRPHSILNVLGLCKAFLGNHTRKFTRSGYTTWAFWRWRWGQQIQGPSTGSDYCCRCLRTGHSGNQNDHPRHEKKSCVSSFPQTQGLFSTLFLLVLGVCSCTGDELGPWVVVELALADEDIRVRNIIVRTPPQELGTLWFQNTMAIYW